MLSSAVADSIINTLYITAPPTEKLQPNEPPLVEFAPANQVDVVGYTRIEVGTR